MSDDDKFALYLQAYLRIIERKDPSISFGRWDGVAQYLKKRLFELVESK